MADTESTTLQAASIAEFAKKVGEGVALAQRAMDEASLQTWRAIHTDPAFKGLLEIGYQPTWYAIPSAEAEIKLFFHFEEDRETGKRRMFGLPLNAQVQARTSLRQEGASQFKLRIVPTPPPVRLGPDTAEG